MEKVFQIGEFKKGLKMRFWGFMRVTWVSHRWRSSTFVLKLDEYVLIGWLKKDVYIVGAKPKKLMTKKFPIYFKEHGMDVIMRAVESRSITMSECVLVTNLFVDVQEG